MQIQKNKIKDIFKISIYILNMVKGPFYEGFVGVLTGSDPTGLEPSLKTAY